MPGILVEPVTTAVMIPPEGWSPDGEVFAFWTFTESQSLIDLSFPPGTLNFYYVNSGLTCTFPYLVNFLPRIQQVYWHAEDRVLILGERFAMTGSPCEGDFSVTQETADPVYRLPVSRLSPNGRYRAQPDFYLPEDPTLARSSIMDVQTGQVVTDVEWRFVETHGLGEADHWVTEQKYLISVTHDQGPLLIDVKQGVTQVAPELFKRPAQVDCGSQADPCETWLAAAGLMVVETGKYHLALYGWGMESNYPPVELYHAESDETEVLPATYFHSFSPDGRWIYVYNEAFDRNKRIPYAVVGLKPVDPPGSPGYFLLKADLSAFENPWSPDSRRVAIKTRKGVYIHSLPDAELVELWELGRYESIQGYWSPDGRYFAVRSSIPVPQGIDAIFVLKAP